LSIVKIDSHKQHEHQAKSPSRSIIHLQNIADRSMADPKSLSTSMQMLEEAKQKLQSTLQDPEQNKTATRAYESAVTRVAEAQQAAAGSRPRQTRRRLCRRCGKRFASPEWRPFHDKPYKHSGKDIWEFCTVGESEFEKGFPCFDILLPKRPKEGDETKPSSKMPKPLTLAKPTHPLKSLPASTLAEKKRIDTFNCRDGHGICDRCGKNYWSSKWRPYHPQSLPDGYLGVVHGSKVFGYCTVPQSECEPGNPMPKISRKRERDDGDDGRNEAGGKKLASDKKEVGNGKSNLQIKDANDTVGKSSETKGGVSYSGSNACVVFVSC
jgi:hypothetical protein